MNYDQLIEKLQDYKNKLIKLDYIHNKNDFFTTMKEFRHFIASIQDEELFLKFYHWSKYNDFKIFFKDKNNYYIRAIEALESVSVMTKWIHENNNFIDLIDVDLIRERYNRKSSDMKSLNFLWNKKLLMVWCWPFPETLIYIYENNQYKI